MRLKIALAIAALALTSPVSGKEPMQAAGARAWAMPERELMVPVEGGRVWVSVNGDLEAAGAPVIFIHGGPGGTHTDFGGLTALADQRAVIFYDQLDSGMSDHPGDPKNWRVARFVAELEAIRTALKIERWHVVGHSWGSAIALEYAAMHPDGVASTVLSGTFISTPHWIMGTNLLIRELAPEVQRDILACEGNNRPSAETCKAAEAAFYAAYAGRPDAPHAPPKRKPIASAPKARGSIETCTTRCGGPASFRRADRWWAMTLPLCSRRLTANVRCS